MPSLPSRRRRPTLVGEQNPYGGDDEYALYPAPEGCSGYRLCCLILGMRRSIYLGRFDRCNLVQGPWNLKQARERAAELSAVPGRYILLGAKVCSAWRTPFVPFAISEGGTVLVLPHPSGRNTLWNDPECTGRARRAVLEFCPELSEVVGRVQVDA